MSEEFNVMSGGGLLGESEAPSCPECNEMEMLEIESIDQEGGSMWECPMCYHRIPIEDKE